MLHYTFVLSKIATHDEPCVKNFKCWLFTFDQNNHTKCNQIKSKELKRIKIDKHS